MRDTCRLCGAESSLRHHGSRRFLQCAECQLVFVGKESLPSIDVERGRYLTHRNSPNDPGYRAFLRPAVESLAPLLAPNAKGLDYGCGPSPALAGLFEEKGFSAESYDPIFSPNHELLEKQYDYVTCTETAEHFHQPSVEFPKLARLLAPGAKLLVMTQFIDDERDLSTWYYARDFTHVAFYSTATMKWIARRFRWDLSLPLPNVAIFRR